MIHFFDELGAPTLFIFDGTVTTEVGREMEKWLAERGGSFSTKGGGKEMGICPVDSRALFILRFGGNV